MNATLQGAWKSRSPQQRAIIAVLAVLVGISLYAWFAQAAGRARAQLRTSATVLRAQAAQVDQQALEHGRLSAAPAATASSTDLLALVQARAGAAGLSQALVRIEALDSEHVTVVFGALAFADWLSWIAGLQSQLVRLDACRIEALSTAGLVSVTATLARAKPQ